MRFGNFESKFKVYIRVFQVFFRGGALCYIFPGLRFEYLLLCARLSIVRFFNLFSIMKQVLRNLRMYMRVLKRRCQGPQRRRMRRLTVQQI